MKIIYSPKYEECYPTNPVESPDRVRLPALELKEAGYEFAEPDVASEKDVAVEFENAASLFQRANCYGEIGTLTVLNRSSGSSVFVRGNRSYPSQSLSF